MGTDRVLVSGREKCGLHLGMLQLRQNSGGKKSQRFEKLLERNERFGYSLDEYSRRKVEGKEASQFK